MADTKAKLTPRTITKLAARRKEIDRLLKELTDEKAEISERLLQADYGQEYVGDGVKLTFTPVHTLDTAFITKKFPASKRPEFYKLTLDTAEFKKHFAPNELETFQKVTHRINVQEV